MTAVEFFTFDADESDDRARVVAVMDDIATGPSGSGWLTLDPEFDERFPPPSQTTFGRLVSGRGPVVPRATWVPADIERRRPEPMSVGVLHATGARSVSRLADDHGIEIPDRWRVAADHSKRGLVLYVPIDVAHREVLDWTLRAAAALTRIPLTGHWRAAVHGA